MLDTITLILALIGSLGTAYSVVMTFFWHRVSIECTVAEYCPTKAALVLYVSFVNHSRLPVSITDISVWNNCILYSCVHTPEVVKTVSRSLNGSQTFQQPIFSSPLPINIPSLSGTSGYVYFLFPQENFEADSTSLTVELSTNRHLTLRKRLSLEKSSRIVQ